MDPGAMTETKKEEKKRKRRKIKVNKLGQRKLDRLAMKYYKKDFDQCTPPQKKVVKKRAEKRKNFWVPKRR